MKKIISFVGIFAGLGFVAGEANGVVMNAQIRRLLQEKQDKIAKLEECEGKKQGWMIAGISTIGLTAVGVGVNIAQASKSNRLSNEIDASKEELARHEANLDRINDKIAENEADEKKPTNDGENYDLDPGVESDDYCYKGINGKDPRYVTGCTPRKPGDWGVVFPYGTVMGISACSSLDGEIGHYEVATDQDQVQSDYTDEVTEVPKGENCFCKMTSHGGSKWVFLGWKHTSEFCSDVCAGSCAEEVWAHPDFRGVVFVEAH